MKRVLGICLLIIACATESMSATVVLQPDNSGKDIIIRSYIPTETVDSTFLYTRNDDPLDLYWTMIEFDLSSIPVQSVNQAVMQIYCYYQEVTTSPTVYANRITESWDESTVNWVSRGSSYTTDGRVSQSGTVSPGWVSWDITDFVNDWLDTSNGIQNYGVMLTTDLIQPDNRTYFYSSDYTSDPSLRPKITLDFVEPPAVPEPASAALIIAAITGLLFRKRSRI